MAKKKEAPNRTNVLERLDHHEKILHLVIDRLNENIDPELKMFAGAIQKNKEDIEGIVGWLARGWWNRTWDRLTRRKEW